MIITIDGIDGVGKSTLAKSLAAKLGYEYIDKPIYMLFKVQGDNNYLFKELSYMQDLIYNQTNSNILKSYFTGLSLLYIKECLTNRNIIVDRGLLSAFAYNGDLDSKIVFENLINLGVFFDGAIVLTASKEERIKRLKARNQCDQDLLNFQILNLKDDAIFNFLYEHKELPCCVIDTNNLNQEQVLEIAYNYVKYLSDIKDTKIKIKK